MNEIKISVIIPAFNEAKRLPKTLKKISDFFKRKNYSYEIVVVDDGSQDKTTDTIKSLNIPNVRVVSYKANRGKGYAVNFGILKAKGKYILFADADNSTPFEQIEKLLEHIENYEVVIGSRYLTNSHIKLKQPLSRRVAARLGNLLIRAMVLPKIEDTQCGFKMFQRHAAHEIFSRQTIWRWGFDIEILYIAKKLGFKIKEVPIDWYNDEATRIQSPRVFLTTFSELLRIKLNSISGKYRR
ncbi:MAG: glycosyltransferase family 2 protein [Candidatus Berkelbacteria bacterium]|nr:glycosyltransferase family 2 protein [Candidatus Berkelbacteria bacterium]